jgi:hypothetical protein
MSEQLRLRGDTATNVAAYTGPQRETVVDITNNRLCVQDGATAGGWPAAKLAEAVLNTASSNTIAMGANGSCIQVAVSEQSVSLSGASTTAGVQIPENSIVLAVGTRVTTTITGATSYEVGVSGNLSQFGSVLGLAAGSTNNGLIGPAAFYSATSLVVTAAGGNFTGGVVRLSIHYLLCGPPTS